MTTEVTLNRQELHASCEHDLNMFASVIIPHIVTVEFPNYYNYLFNLFTIADAGNKRKLIRFALGLPRGHAKTTFIKLLICWAILYDAYFFILIVCANEELAKNSLEDIATMLTSEQVVNIWGDWRGGLTRDTKELKRGIHHGKDKIMAALGAQSSVRGINIANRRPDFIFCDDIQSEANARSIAEAGYLYNWFIGTLLKARDMQHCLVMYVGNMYNEDCILFKLKMHPMWETFITSGILPSLKPLWPAYFSLADLLAEYEHDLAAGKPEIFFAEVMNIPQGGKLSLLPNGALPESGIAGYEEALASFITIDPAGFRETSDDNVICRHGIYPDLLYQVDDIVAGRMTPDEIITITLAQAIEYNIKFIFVETVAYQQVLKWLFEKELALRPSLSDVKIIDLKPGGRKKTDRIRTWISTVVSGNYHVASAVKRKVILQALAFRVDRTDNKDDILDCCAYGNDVKFKHQNDILSMAAYLDDMASTVRFGQRKRSAKIVENNTFLD